MSFAFSNFKVTVTGTSYFALLTAVRMALEQIHALPNCYGASRNVWPSPMSFLVDKGKIAFRLKFGEQVQTESVVSIFATGEDVDPVTVAEQEAFLRNGSGVLANLTQTSQ